MNAKRGPALLGWLAVMGTALVYVPLCAMVYRSFRLSTIGGHSGWTFDWYRLAFRDDGVLGALRTSLEVAVACSVICTILGLSAAFALSRCRFFGKALIEFLIQIPLVMPEIVLGLSLLVWFVWLRFELGVASIALAHVTFSISFVILGLKSRIDELDPSLDDAARDLGATPWKSFIHVQLPVLMPAILSGALMAFTLSFDDFLVTYFTAGVGSETLPLKIYSMVKFGVSPEINAISTLMLFLTGVFVFLFSGGLPVSRKH